MLPLSLVRNSCKLKVLKLRLSLSFFFFTYTALHFCIGLVTNYFNLVFLFSLFLYFLARSFFDQEPQFNSISLNLRSKPASICAQFLLSFVYPPPTVQLLFYSCSHHIIIQSHGSADCFCILFLLRSVCLFFFHFLFLFTLFSLTNCCRRLSSSVRRTLQLSRLHACLHNCIALRVSTCQLSVIVCVCVCRLMDSSSSKWW